MVSEHTLRDSLGVRYGGMLVCAMSRATICIDAAVATSGIVVFSLLRFEADTSIVAWNEKASRRRASPFAGTILLCSDNDRALRSQYTRSKCRDDCHTGRVEESVRLDL